MPSEAVECRVEVVVEDDDLEGALRKLMFQSYFVLKELKRRSEAGPKPSARRRSKRWYSPRRTWHATFAAGTRHRERGGGAQWKSVGAAALPRRSDEPPSS